MYVFVCLCVGQRSTNDIVQLPSVTVVHPVFFFGVEFKTLSAHSISQSSTPFVNSGMLTVVLKPLYPRTQVGGICWVLKPQRFVDLVAVMTGNQTLVSWRGQEFCFSSQKLCQRFSFLWLTDSIFMKYATHRKKSGTLNNLNHFLTFVPTFNHNAWSLSADLKDVNNQPGLFLTANKPGKVEVMQIFDTVLSLSV